MNITEMFFRLVCKAKAGRILHAALFPFFHEYIVYGDEIVNKARQTINEVISNFPNGSCLKSDNTSPTDEFELQVIIPVYNAEKFVERCIESALSSCQRHSMIITVVNDGSSDRSGEILKKFDGNPHVEIITQENRAFRGQEIAVWSN